MTQTTPTTNTNNPQTNNSPTKTSNGDGSHNYGSRFFIALSLIVGMLIILVISVAQAQFTQTTQLAAIFSGWITSIVAFYFYGQSTAQAQTQIKTVTQSAANSEQRATQAERKLSNINSMVTVHSAILKTVAPEKAATASDEVINNIKAILQKD
jgi:H+/gluconate symporter-like permease